MDILVYTPDEFAAMTEGIFLRMRYGMVLWSMKRKPEQEGIR